MAPEKDLAVETKIKPKGFGPVVMAPRAVVPPETRYPEELIRTYQEHFKLPEIEPQERAIVDSGGYPSLKDYSELSPDMQSGLKNLALNQVEERIREETGLYPVARPMWASGSAETLLAQGGKQEIANVTRRSLEGILMNSESKYGTRKERQEKDSSAFLVDSSTCILNFLTLD